MSAWPVEKELNRESMFLTFTHRTRQLTAFSIIQIPLLTMCRWRQVRNLYLRCGHHENLPPVEVKCISPRCKFSPNHPAGCVPPSCTRTCVQYHLYPEQYNPNIDGYCSTCSRGRRH
ncbi:hypothetical protein DFH06DRAFT_1320089 [Mycena polygramma]|nr:hypothetical protein DFH06DRAFT_1320089 [Mycena polygramma]